MKKQAEAREAQIKREKEEEQKLIQEAQRKEAEAVERAKVAEAEAAKTKQEQFLKDMEESAAKEEVPIKPENAIILDREPDEPDDLPEEAQEHDWGVECPACCYQFKVIREAVNNE